MIARRAFLRNGALTLVGTAAVPHFLVRSVMAEQAVAAASGKKLVVLFQRGAADGLNIVVPYREQNYYAMRPNIAIQPGEVLDLGRPVWPPPCHGAAAAAVSAGPSRDRAAVGSPDTTRSHFDAQDYMESGTPGNKGTQDGWLNRALQAERVTKPSAFRAVALGTQVPRTLQGRLPAVAVSNVANFAVGTNQGNQAAAVSTAFQAMYAGTHDRILSNEGDETFEAVRMLRATDPAHYKPANGVTYPNTPFSNSLKQVAQLMKANLALKPPSQT